MTLWQKDNIYYIILGPLSLPVKRPKASMAKWGMREQNDLDDLKAEMPYPRVLRIELNIL